MSVNAISTAQMLGGTKVLRAKVKSDRDLERIVAKGLPIGALVKLVERIFPGETGKHYELVPRTTLIRRQNQKLPLSMEESQKAERLARVFSFAVEVWGDEEKARNFMKKTHPMLENRTPFNASLSELGARQVEQLLGRLMLGISA